MGRTWQQGILCQIHWLLAGRRPQAGVQAGQLPQGRQRLHAGGCEVEELVALQ